MSLNFNYALLIQKKLKEICQSDLKYYGRKTQTRKGNVILIKKNIFFRFNDNFYNFEVVLNYSRLNN